jgi:hypothetical protein
VYKFTSDSAQPVDELDRSMEMERRIDFLQEQIARSRRWRRLLCCRMPGCGREGRLISDEQRSRSHKQIVFTVPLLLSFLQPSQRSLEVLKSTGAAFLGRGETLKKSFFFQSPFQFPLSLFLAPV